MLAPCLHDLSKHDLKQVPEGGYRIPSTNVNAMQSGIFARRAMVDQASCQVVM